MSAKERGAILALLGRRDYTAAELRERLIKKEYDAAGIDEEIVALTADGTINDRRVAASFIRVASQVKGRGKVRIRLELIARGVSKQIVSELLAELPVENDIAAIRKFIERKRLPDHPTPQQRQRVFQQLLRRGFAADAITRVLRGRPDDDD